MKSYYKISSIGNGNIKTYEIDLQMIDSIISYIRELDEEVCIVMIEAICEVDTIQYLDKDSITLNKKTYTLSSTTLHKKDGAWSI